MDSNIVLDSLLQSFGNEPYPGDDQIMENNSDLESIGIRDSLKQYTWQTITPELMQYEQYCLPFLSKIGFKYYLPAFMRFAITDFHGADMIPDNIILRLRLPIEADVITSAIEIRELKMDENMPSIDWNEILQSRLKSIESSIHNFIAKASLFNTEQSRAIYQFLVYMRDVQGAEFFNDEPDVAIQRYWFQFAE